MKKLLTILTVLIVFAGCNKYQNQNNLVMAVKGEVESLDPVFSYDGVTHGLLLNIYDTVIKFKGSSLTEFEPLLALRVPTVENGLISKDGKTYIFEIRPEVKFHDGTPLTAQDIAYSLQRFLISDTLGGPSSLLLEPILGRPATRDRAGNINLDFTEVQNAITTEGNKVIIKLKEPFAPFLSILARWSYIISKNWAAQNGEWDGTAENWQKFNNRDKAASYLFNNANGSGPFMVERWDIPAKRIYLKANKNYFLPPPALESVQLLSISEQSTMRLMLESGDADIVEISGAFARQIVANPKITVDDALPRLKTDPVIFFTFDINAEVNPDIGSGKLDGEGIPSDFFKDINLRKAFSYAFDYDSFVKDSMDGKAPRAIGAIPPALLKQDGLKRYNFDIKKATQYFKKAHEGKVWENGFKFTLTYNTGSDMRQMAAEILKRNVEAINPKFRIELRGLPWANFLEKTQARKMPMWVRGWIADYPDAHNFVFPFLHSQGRYAIAQNFSDPNLDKLINQAVREVSPAKRAVLYAQIHNISNELAGQIYTVHSPGVWVYNKNVKNFIDNPVFMGIYFYPIHKTAQ